MEVIFWHVGHNMLLNKTGFLPNRLTLAFCGLEDVGLADAGFLFQGILHADRKIQKRVWPREANSSAKYNIASGLVRVWARSFKKYAGQHLPLSFLCYNCLLPPHTAALLHLNSTMPRTFVAYTSHHVARIIKPRCSENKISKNKHAPTPAASLVAFHFAHQLLQQTKTRVAPWRLMSLDMSQRFCCVSQAVRGSFCAPHGFVDEKQESFLVFQSQSINFSDLFSVVKITVLYKQVPQ